MSTAFANTVKALNDNPELANKVMAAGTPAERAEILKAAGVAVPTQADVSAAHAASLDDVAGAGNTKTYVTQGAPAVAPAAASAFAAS